MDTNIDSGTGSDTDMGHGIYKKNKYGKDTRKKKFKYKYIYFYYNHNSFTKISNMKTLVIYEFVSLHSSTR